MQLPSLKTLLVPMIAATAFMAQPATADAKHWHKHHWDHHHHHHDHWRYYGYWGYPKHHHHHHWDYDRYSYFYGPPPYAYGYSPYYYPPYRRNVINVHVHL